MTSGSIRSAGADRAGGSDATGRAACMRGFEPVVIALPPELTAVKVFERLVGCRHCLFLDSAQLHPTLGRYSFVTADPFEWIESSAEDRGALARVAQRMRQWPSEPKSGLPPFQGGAAGLLAYDFSRAFERLQRPTWDEFGLPGVAFGFYDMVLAFDHQQDRGWLISQGLPETEPRARAARAERRAAWLLEQLETPAGAKTESLAAPDAARAADGRGARRAIQAPTFPTGRDAALVSNFTADGYRRMVERAIALIRAGDIFQVNVSQRLLYPAIEPPVKLYMRLRQQNAATFAGFLDGGEFQVLSTSPERFLRLEQGEVEARPIKGTRRRTSWPEVDMFAGRELIASPKDRAENVMIVDLMRNDLSRVCQDETIFVSQLCGLETYAYVQHLVSAIRGRLRPDVGPAEMLAATFPGGSVTGAPKIRAMEIISELEQVARGAYCGSLGYWSVTGACDFNILIRTITAAGGWWQFPVGGGIVVGSDPDQEYRETWHKAEGLLRALPCGA